MSDVERDTRRTKYLLTRRLEDARIALRSALMGERLPLRILLSEDNLVNQEMALHLPERMEYRADVTSNDLERPENHPAAPGTLRRLR